MSVGEELAYDLVDLGGGVNDGLPVTHIRDNEAALSENLYSFGTKKRRRGGSKLLTAGAHAEALTSLFAFKLSTGTWLLLVGAMSGVLKLDGSGLTALTVADGKIYAPSADQWHFRQYKDEVLAARKGTGTIKRLTEDTIQDAGIVGPTAAPTVADGGAGQLPAGDYLWVYTFYVTRTGAESNPSPPSAKLTLGANKKATISNLQTSSNGQVDARRVYRVLKDNTAEYFFAFQVNDNFGTGPYSDNVLQDDLGRAVSFNNGLPPPNVENIELWRERLWATDGRDLFFSGLGFPQGFGEFDVLSVYPDDGHRIRALLAYSDRLMVGKTNAVHQVVRAGERFGLQTLTDKHGVSAASSLKTAEGLLFWYSGENVYRSDGVNVSSISTVKIRKALDRIPNAMKERAFGFVYPTLSWYGLCVSQGSATQNEAVLLYNYKTDVWDTLKFPGGAPSCVGDFFDAQLATILYAVFYDARVYQLQSGSTDAGTHITCKWRSKGLGLDRGSQLKGVRRVHLQVPSVPETITARIFNDEKAIAAKERTVSLNQSRPWKRISLSTLKKLAATFQVELEYSGLSDFEIEALHVAGRAFARHGKVI